MKLKIALLTTLLILTIHLTAFAEVKNEGLANQIIAARQKNDALMPQYNWNCRTEYIDNAIVKDIRIDAVTFGPDGKLQRTVLNDQSAPLPRGFLRKAVAEDERKQIEKYLQGLHALLDQYTLSSAGAMINFVSQATIQTGAAPDGTPTLTLTGANVITPGDTVVLTLNPTNFQTLRMEIATTYDTNPITMSATFKTIKAGLTHLQFATILIPNKTVSLQIHNYDYTPND